MISCYIFDLDGVIVNTSAAHFRAWKKIALLLDIPFSEKQNEKLKGVSREESLKILLGFGRRTLTESEFSELLKLKNQFYLVEIENLNSTDILPAVTEKINFLKNSGYQLGLASSSKNAKTVLQKIQLDDVFDAVIDGNQVKEPKPNPEIFLTTSKKLAVNPADCAVFEDAVAGIEAARKAGMLTIGIGEARILENADYVFENFSRISNQFLLNLKR